MFRPSKKNCLFRKKISDRNFYIYCCSFLYHRILYLPFKQQTDAKQLEYEAYKYYFQQKFSQAGSLFAQAYEKRKM